MSHTIPLDFQFGVAKQLSVGLYFEYGNYKDFEYGSYIDTFTYVGSNDTLTSGRFLDTLASNSKRLYHVGLAPRFYIMNKYRFNWMIGPEFGISAVQFNDFAVDFNNKKFSDVYVGIHFRLATGVSYYFGNHFGLQAQVRYGMSSMKWRDRDPENSVFDSLDYQSKLTATGFQFGLGLTVRMGK
ncbi:MAG: outer membrane beta-barrel protein [Flavobacteriales bacterium]